jgi:teichoic acid transport system ATP-binding protein
MLRECLHLLDFVATSPDVCDGPNESRHRHRFKRIEALPSVSHGQHRFLGIFSNRIPFKEVYANRDLSFTIARGESVAVMGKNGAGKSTMLKMITGVAFPTAGDIVVNGRVSALLELTAGFDNELTGRENVHLRGQIWGLENEEIKELEAKVVEFADIGDYIDQPVRTYSSGMKARVGFAISAHINPEILVVDEALSVGDKAFREKCDRLVKEIMEKRITVIFMTHSAGAAAIRDVASSGKGRSSSTVPWTMRRVLRWCPLDKHGTS